MLIEHRFVTTLEPVDAMRIAHEFLASRGFARSETPQAFAVGSQEWTVLEMRRGGKAARRYAGVIDQPQSVRLEYDRGRVNVAASIASATGADHKPGSATGQAYANLLMALVSCIEQLLAMRQPPEQVALTLSQVEAPLAALALRKRRRRRIGLVLALLFVALAVTGLVIAILYS